MGAGAVLLFMGLIVLAVFLRANIGLVRASGAYQQALAKAEAEPAVSEALGAPIRGRLFLTGMIEQRGPGTVLMFPITGPKGKAHVFGYAKLEHGQWTFPQLAVEIKSTGKRIDLLAPKSAPDSSVEGRTPVVLTNANDWVAFTNGLMLITELQKPDDGDAVRSAVRIGRLTGKRALFVGTHVPHSDPMSSPEDLSLGNGFTLHVEFSPKRDVQPPAGTCVVEVVGFLRGQDGKRLVIQARPEDWVAHSCR